MVKCEGSEFQTNKAQHWKAPFAISVLVNGMGNTGVSEECNVRAHSLLHIHKHPNKSYQNVQ